MINQPWTPDRISLKWNQKNEGSGKVETHAFGHNKYSVFHFPLHLIFSSLPLISVLGKVNSACFLAFFFFRSFFFFLHFCLSPDGLVMVMGRGGCKYLIEASASFPPSSLHTTTLPQHRFPGACIFHRLQRKERNRYGEGGRGSAHQSFLLPSKIAVKVSAHVESLI